MPIKLKNKTNLIVKETGKPVFKLEGENVSEKSATIKVDDFWVNLPSIHGNMRYSEDELYDMVMNGKIKVTSVHKKQPDAIKAAKERSKNLTIIKGSAFNQGGYGVAGKFTPDTGVSAAKEKGNFKGLGYKGEAKEAPAETKPFQEPVDMSSGGDDDKSASASVTLDRIKKNQLAQTKFTPANFQDALSGQFDQYKKVDPETYSGLKFQQTDKDEPLGFLGEPANQTLKERQEEIKNVSLSETAEMAKARVKNSIFNKLKEMSQDFKNQIVEDPKNITDVQKSMEYWKIKAPMIQAVIESGFLINAPSNLQTFNFNEKTGEYDLGKNKFVGNLDIQNPLHVETIHKFYTQATGVKNIEELDVNNPESPWFWCSAFIHDILTKAGAKPLETYDSYDRARARKYANYGTKVDGIENAKSGDIILKGDPITGKITHLTIYIGPEIANAFEVAFKDMYKKDFVLGLGGNQGGPDSGAEVNVKPFDIDGIVGVRRIDKITPKMIDQLKKDNPQYKGFVESATPPVQRPEDFYKNPGIVEKAKEPMKRPKEFNKGGTTMEQQMSLFEEGGMKDDGLDRDPVSGNDIPPGSLAKEVRDDIPAQLSDGEYVVPADVVQYFGVKFFEDIRAEAKRGLAEMEATGRIGGEPVEVDMTMIAFGQAKEEEEKKKKAQGGVIHANDGVLTVDDDYFKQQAINKANPTAGFQRVGQSIFGQTPTGNVPMPGTVLITKTFYHPDGRIQAVQGTMRGNPPAFVPNQGFDQFTKAPWSETAPSQKQATTQKQERDDSKDPQFTSTEFLSGSDQYKGLVGKDGKPIAVKILDSKGRVRVMTPEGYNAVVTSANRLGLDADTYYNLPFNTKRKLAGQELKSIFGGKVDDKKVDEILADSSKDGEGFFDQLFNGIVSGIKKIFGVEDTDTTPTPESEGTVKAIEESKSKDNDNQNISGDLTIKSDDTDLQKASKTASKSVTPGASTKYVGRTDTKGKKLGDVGYKSALRERQEAKQNKAKGGLLQRPKRRNKK